MSANSEDAISRAGTLEIPNKLYFRIGEAARIAGVKPYVLRFWETQFPALGPRKAGSGHRLYRRKDVELVLEIKNLLYGNRYTIEGARKFLETRQHTGKALAAATPRFVQGELFRECTYTYDDVRQELGQILALLR
jgi:DNA-binding transcriptional MerR regulator